MCFVYYASQYLRGNTTDMTSEKKFWWGRVGTPQMNQTALIAEVIRAAESGDIGKLKKLQASFRSGFFKVRCEKTMSTPLHVATAASHGYVVKYLLSKGADPNVQDNSFETPLHIAAKIGATECLLLLLSAKAKKEMVDAWGRTPLLKAVVYNRPKCVHWLLDAGANTNVKDVDGLSPLHVAASYGQVVLLRKLVKAGARLNVVNRKGRLPLSKAIKNTGHTAIVEEIIKYGAKTYYRDHCVVKDAISKLAQAHPAARENDDNNFKMAEIVISAHGYSLHEDILDLFLSIYRSLDAKLFLPILMKLALISGKPGITAPLQLPQHHMDQLDKFLPADFKLFSLKTLALRRVRELLMVSGKNVVWACERLHVAPTMKKIILLEVIY